MDVQEHGWCPPQTKLDVIIVADAGVAELADAADLGSVDRKVVEVQVLSPAPSL